MEATYTLSIIIPFYNAEKKSSKILKRLANLSSPDIEAIYINDGSTDNTKELLKTYERKNKINTSVITQQNKGPGGARNTGLRAARGKYVWFVDADDDINPEAIDFLRSIAHKNYDLIDYNENNDRNILRHFPIEEGEYSGERAKQIIFQYMDVNVNKHIKRSFLIENDLFYPEYCFYEDIAMYIQFPFYIRSFYKSDITAYNVYTYNDGVSRSPLNDKLYDRLFTMKWALERVWNKAENEEERNIIIKKFTRGFLINTLKSGRIPNELWVMDLRVMAFYKKIYNDYNMGIDPFSFWKFSKLQTAKLRLLWNLAGLLPDQTEYFRKIRQRAWGRIELHD